MRSHPRINSNEITARHWVSVESMTLSSIVHVALSESTLRHLGTHSVKTVDVHDYVTYAYKLHYYLDALTGQTVLKLYIGALQTSSQFHYYSSLIPLILVEDLANLTHTYNYDIKLRAVLLVYVVCR